MTGRRVTAALLAIALLALALRVVFPAADPPWRTTVGVVWHDEGSWVHNARNKALFGGWRQDEWNPVYIAPVFTALEYASFSAFGVGVRQARLVSELAGLVSVILLALGMRRVAGDTAALLAGALLATNYVYVMYDRAAIMEGLMTAFIVASWYCSARAERQPAWGAGAGLMATLAFFTKAAAAFYIAALGLAVVVRLAEAWRVGDLPPNGGNHERPGRSHEEPGGRHERPRTSRRGTDSLVRRAALWTLGGLVLSSGAVAILFVLPHWADYRFYNWQMSVTRKPSYDLHSIFERVTWFPILHDTFSRLWVALCLAVLGAWGVLTRWRRAGDAERLLFLWVSVGTLELLVHDDGNERRFVFLIPAIAALAARVLERGSLLPPDAASITRARLWVVAPVILYSAYVLCGPLARLPFLADVRAHVLHSAVRLAATGAVLLGAVVIVSWPRVSPLLGRRAWKPAAAITLALLLIAWDLAQFGEWAFYRTYKDYAASIALGRALPPETLIQGKLANGLSLENRIRPIFIGHEFGNYADRKQREDVRYILTYTDPRIGFEGSQIEDVLAAYPGWRIIMTFDVAETPSGHDSAVLIDKRARH